MEAQIVKIGDKKWGSKVSQKLFVDRAFVVKHIRNKHTHLLDAEREQVRPSRCLLRAAACSIHSATQSVVSICLCAAQVPPASYTAQCQPAVCDPHRHTQRSNNLLSVMSVVHQLLV